MPYLYNYQKGYETIPAKKFDELGMAMINKSTDGSKVVHDRRFKATFGCLPQTCSDLWHLILTSRIGLILGLNFFREKLPN